MNEAYASRHRDMTRHKQAILENEKLLAKDPIAYQKRLRWFAIFGYVLYALIAAFGLALGYGCYLLIVHVAFSKLTIYACIFAAVLLFAIITSLYIPFPLEGRSLELKRSEAPKLWAMVDSVSANIKGPKIDRIFITYEFNASALQWPRFGLFGKVSNILSLGLPLMMGFDEASVRGIIAHELGHFAGEHGKKSGFIYRSAILFGNLYSRLEQSENMALLIIRPIFNWYYPRLEQLSLPVSRLNEYEADRVAVGEVGAEVYGGSLTRLRPNVVWFDTYLLDKIISSLPATPFEWLYEAMSSAKPATIFESELKKEIEETTAPDSTHPCLNDRLKSIGRPTLSVGSVEALTGQYNQKFQPNAFETLIEPRAADLLKSHLEAWVRPIQDIFRKNYSSAITAPIEELYKLDEEPTVIRDWTPDSSLSVLQQMNQLRTRRLDLGDASYAVQWKKFCDMHPSDMFVTYCTCTEIGGIDPEYAKLRLPEISNHPTFGLAACAMLVHLYEEANQPTLAAPYFERQNVIHRWIEITCQNLAALGKFEIVAPQLSETYIEDVRDAISHNPSITAAYLCQLKSSLKTGPYNGYLTVLFYDSLTPKQAKWRWGGSAVGDSEQVTASLQNNLAGIIIPIAMCGQAVKWYKKVTQQPNSALKLK